MSKLDPRIEAIRVKYDLRETDFWEIKQKPGTWVAKHAALEVAAVKAGISFDMPQIIEHDAVALTCSVVVQGLMGERREWSTGETNPTNYHVTGKQPSYPWAMAEKRAKDRVILKLIGLHGYAYSEDEAEDFREPAPAAQVERLSSYRAKTVLNIDAMLKEIDTAATPKVLDNLIELYTVLCAPWFPSGWADRLVERIEERRVELAKGPVDPSATLDRQFSETMREDRPFPGDLPPETVRAVKLANTP